MEDLSLFLICFRIKNNCLRKGRRWINLKRTSLDLYCLSWGCLLWLRSKRKNLLFRNLSNWLRDQVPFSIRTTSILMIRNKTLGLLRLMLKGMWVGISLLWLEMEAFLHPHHFLLAHLLPQRKTNLKIRVLVLERLTMIHKRINIFFPTK
jgi:hypothetical protein